MKAMGFYKNGGPEVLEELEAEEPQISEHEILIRMTNTSLNNLDVLMRSGATKPPGMQLPHVPGSDIVGIVEKAGKGVENVQAGEKVVANTLHGCGKCAECASGNEVLCKDWRVIGIHSWGSYGELVKVPSRIAAHAPKGFSDEELGCMPLALSVSWRSLRWAAGAKEGETVAIRGASGNAGIFSILLSKAMGLKVIAITRSQAKADSLRGIGADRVVVSEGDEEKAKHGALEASGGLGADIVLDCMGSTLNDSIAMVRHGGRVVVFGTIGGADSKIEIKKYYWRSARIIGVHNANLQELQEGLEFMRQKGIKPVIAKKMGIREASGAHRLFSESKVFGKIAMRHRW